MGIWKSTFIYFISSIVVIIVPGVRSIPTLIFHIPNISLNEEIIAPSFISSSTSASFAWASCNFIFWKSYSFLAMILLYFRKESRVNSLCCSCRFISACFCTAFCFSSLTVKNRWYQRIHLKPLFLWTPKLLVSLSFLRVQYWLSAVFVLLLLFLIYLYTHEKSKKKKTAYNNQ